MSSSGVSSGRADRAALGELIRDFPDVVLVVDRTGCVVLASESARATLAGPAGDLVGTPLAELLPDQSVQARVDAILHDPDDRRPHADLGSPVRGRCAPAGAAPIDVDVTIGEIRSQEGDDPLVVVTVRERPDLAPPDAADEVWRYFDAAVRLAGDLDKVNSEEEAIASILPIVAGRLDWDVACLWLVAPDGHSLVCAATWPNDGGPTQAFEDASMRMSARAGQGIPGSAWSSGRPLITSVGIGETRLLRQDVILECGLKTGLAFPLEADTDVIGVIEMFSRRTLPISVKLLDGAASLGRQIGRLLHQARSERHEREVERVRSFLVEASTVLSASAGYTDALRRLAALSVPEMADLCLIDVKERDGSISRKAAVHADPAKAALVAELEAGYPPSSGSAHPSNEVMSTGISSWSPTITEDYLRATTRDERHLEIVRELGFESYMCIPLKEGDEVLGAITLVSAGSGRRFRAADLALPEELARRAAVLVASARRHDTEHQLAQQLQRLLLPESLPDVPGFELCVRYVAAAPQAEAGGDFYDVVTLPSGRIGLLIGDVEGHDTLAAATMGQLRSAIRALAGQVREPGELVDALRWSWGLLGFERYATALFARLDQGSGEVVISSAGHPPPALIDVVGTARLVPVEPSPPLGMLGSEAQDHRLVLEPGEVLFLYTDGLVEQRGVDFEPNFERLVRALQAWDGQTLDDLCGQTLSRLTQGHRQDDDIALLAVRRRP